MHNQTGNDNYEARLETLIPERGKDPLIIQNWRPVSLLNTDYKILAQE